VLGSESARAGGREEDVASKKAALDHDTVNRFGGLLDNA
jgi:hypothetical protein